MKTFQSAALGVLVLAIIGLSACGDDESNVNTITVFEDEIDGTLVSGATVELYATASEFFSGSPVASGVTDAEGTFSVSNDLEGAYVVYVNSGFKSNWSAPGTANLDPGTSNDVSVSIRDNLINYLFENNTWVVDRVEINGEDVTDITDECTLDNTFTFGKSSSSQSFTATFQDNSTLCDGSDFTSEFVITSVNTNGIDPVSGEITIEENGSFPGSTRLLFESGVLSFTSGIGPFVTVSYVQQ